MKDTSNSPKYTQIISLRLTPNLRVSLEKLQGEKKVHLSAIIREAVRLYLEANEKGAHHDMR